MPEPTPATYGAGPLKTSPDDYLEVIEMRVARLAIGVSDRDGPGRAQLGSPSATCFAGDHELDVVACLPIRATADKRTAANSRDPCRREAYAHAGVGLSQKSQKITIATPSHRLSLDTLAYMSVPVQASHRAMNKPGSAPRALRHGKLVLLPLRLTD